MKATQDRLKVMEDHLLVNTYLVGDRLTLADLFATSIISRGFQFFFDKEWRSNNPCITRWYETIRNQPIYSDVAGKAEYIEKAIPNTPPKKEEKPKEAAQPKKQEKKKAVEKDDDEEEDDVPAAPKAKHPLEALPKPTFVLDDWYVLAMCSTHVFRAPLTYGVIGSESIRTKKPAQSPFHGSGRTANSMSTACGVWITSTMTNSR